MENLSVYRKLCLSLIFFTCPGHCIHPATHSLFLSVSNVMLKRGSIPWTMMWRQMSMADLLALFLESCAKQSKINLCSLNALRHIAWFFDGPAWNQELDLILMCSFEVRIFHNFMILWNLLYLGIYEAPFSTVFQVWSSHKELDRSLQGRAQEQFNSVKN